MRDIEINFTGQVIEAPTDVRAVAGFRTTHFVLRHIPTYYDASTDQWNSAEDNDFTCIAWKDLADAVVDIVSVGDYVIVSGILRKRKVYDDEGYVVDAVDEVIVRDIGPSLRYRKQS